MVFVGRSAAASLDLLANRYGEQILPTVVPLIEQLFQCDEWPRVESGILALGAIAEGLFFRKQLSAQFVAVHHTI